MKFDLEFYTDYGQFYLTDKNSAQVTNSNEFWSDQAFVDKLAVEDGILGIGIGRQYGTIKCNLKVLDSKNPERNFTDFDHVVEANIKMQSGVLQILDCPNSAVEFETKVDSGEYRVRVYSINLASSYDDDPADSYKIQMWKEDFSERNVLKRYLG